MAPEIDRPYVDQFAVVSVRPDLDIPCYIADYRKHYGHPQVNCLPIVGVGSFWIDTGKVKYLTTPSDIWNNFLKGVAVSCDGQTLK